MRRARDGLTIGGRLWAAAEAVWTAIDLLVDALGHPRHYAALNHLSAPSRAGRIIHARPESAAVPSMPDRETYSVVEDDDGTCAVVWASTERVVEWNGAAQRGLTLDEAEDAADHLEELDRIAAGRRALSSS